MLLDLGNEETEHEASAGTDEPEKNSQKKAIEGSVAELRSIIAEFVDSIAGRRELKAEIKALKKENQCLKAKMHGEEVCRGHIHRIKKTVDKFASILEEKQVMEAEPVHDTV